MSARTFYGLACTLLMVGWCSPARAEFLPGQPVTPLTTPITISITESEPGLNESGAIIGLTIPGTTTLIPVHEGYVVLKENPNIANNVPGNWSDVVVFGFNGNNATARIFSETTEGSDGAANRFGDVGGPSNEEIMSGVRIVNGMTTPLELTQYIPEVSGPATYVAGTITYGITSDFEMPDVPEPASLRLLGLGVIGLLGYVWLRHQRSPRDSPPSAHTP